ncbi:MAG: redoxin domain-containing protein [Bacteroidota bacterium]
MKRIISVILLFLIISITIVLLAGISGKLKKHDQLVERIKQLPEFTLLTLDNTSFSSSEIKEGPLLIVYFHPECEHCRYEISELFRSSLPGSGIPVLLVSRASRDSVTLFLEEFDFPETDEIITLIDTAFVFEDTFGNSIIPSGYLYDKNLNLIDALHGEYKIETILNRLKESE